MKKYSIKKYRNKRRNVKKYKKSQKNGKTRRYKVSKNINRHYSLRKGKGIRRHMSGGVYNFRTDRFAFNLDPDKLKDYVNYKYFGDRPNNQEFTKLKRVAFGKVAITKNSSDFWFRADNRYEQISVFACYRMVGGKETLICYVIARCISPRSCERTFNDYKPRGYHDRPTDGMEEKLVVVDCRNVKRLEFKELNTENQKTAFNDFVKTEARNRGISEQDLRTEINAEGGYHLFEFGTLNTGLYRSLDDPVDTYRVIILPIDDGGDSGVKVPPSGEGFPGDEALTGSQRLVKFFDYQANKENPIKKDDQRYATQEVEFRKASTGNGADGAAAATGVLGLVTGIY